MEEVSSWSLRRYNAATGTAVSLAFMLREGKVHGVIFFPRWVALDPKKTVCFQNEHLNEMHSYRDARPTYPRLVIDEFASINFIEECGAGNESVIACTAQRIAGELCQTPQLGMGALLLHP
jgi:phenolic acid decarboxylase